MKLLAIILLSIGAMNALAAEQQTAITTQDELSRFVQGYYKNPQPEQVESAMRFMAGPGASLMTDENSSRMMQTTFACLFKRHPEKRDAWKKTIASFPEAGRGYFQVSMESSVEAMFQATPTVPEKNDMSWGCFFVTGDISYAQDVILAMKHLDERKDLYKYLTAATAQWSLAGISRDDARVRAALEATAKGEDKQLADAAQVALTKPIGEIRSTTVEVLKQQKDAGVW